jgi:DNA-directed RNA polymerase specialized sigma24 family protein
VTQNVPEEQIVNLARNGNRDAFSELVHRNDSYLGRLAYTMIYNPVVVDEIVAESFLGAICRYPTRLSGFKARQQSGHIL